MSCEESSNIINSLSNKLTNILLIMRVINRDKECDFILLDFIDKIKIIFLVLLLNIL